MQKWIKLLSGLLLVQLLLALLVNLSGGEHGAYQAKEKLLSFDVQAVDGLQIESDGQQVSLKKQDERWLLPDDGNFPADQTSVKRLLDSLAGLRQGWPVATTGSALHRFKVADDEFNTRLTLLQDDKKLARLYVGTSPGFRKVHLRPEGAEAVFAASFNSWEASAKADDWIDKEVLKLDPDDVDKLELPDVTLQSKDDALQVAVLADQEKTNEEEVTDLLGKLTGLQIQSVLGTEVKPEYRLDSPDLEFKLVLKQGEPLDYRFAKPEGESYYVLKRSDLDYYFKIPQFSVKPLLEANRQKLVQSEVKTSDTPVEAQDAAAGTTEMTTGEAPTELPPAADPLGTAQTAQ